MQSYYMIKLKCLMIRLAAAGFLFLFSLSVIVSIVREVTSGYDTGSQLAYVIGILICVLLLLIGVFLTYQAFHFETFVFGRKTNPSCSYKGSEIYNAVFTEDYLIFFGMNLLRLCTMISNEDIIACFETPEEGTVEKAGECQLTIFTKKFKSYHLSFKGKQIGDGHQLRMLICERLPWIHQKKMAQFADEALTKNGRRKLIQAVEDKKYHAGKEVDNIEEAVLDPGKTTSDKSKKNVKMRMPALGKIRKTDIVNRFNIKKK